MRGQDVIVCATGWSAHALQYKLLEAATEAGVKRFIPSEWGFDNADIKNQDLCPIFKEKGEFESYIRSKQSGSFSWTAVATSIWLEWALGYTFLGIDTVAHTAQYWNDGSHAFSNTTLPYSAQATLQILKHPELFQNQRVFLSGVEASQRQIVAELERQKQGEKYTDTQVNGEQIVRDAQAQWSSGDKNAAYTLVTAGILLPEYKANFATAGKKPILEEMVDIPKLTLEEVVRDYVNGAERN